MARLVNNQEIWDRILPHSTEALVKGKHPGDMIAYPILPAPDLPEKVLATRQSAKLQRQFGDVQTRILFRMLQLEPVGVVGYPCGQSIKRSFNTVALLRGIEFASKLTNVCSQLRHTVAEVVDILARRNISSACCTRPTKR